MCAQLSDWCIGMEAGLWHSMSWTAGMSSRETGCQGSGEHNTATTLSVSFCAAKAFSSAHWWTGQYNTQIPSGDVGFIWGDWGIASAVSLAQHYSACLQC